MSIMFAVLAAAWLIYLVVRVMVSLRGASGLEPVRLVVQVQDQEQAIEGLGRRLVRLGLRHWPEVEVVVVDCGSRDSTAAILSRLPLICGVPLAESLPGGRTGEIFFDVRELKGRQLLEAPVFSAISFGSPRR